MAAAISTTYQTRIRGRTPHRTRADEGAGVAALAAGCGVGTGRGLGPLALGPIVVLARGCRRWRRGGLGASATTGRSPAAAPGATRGAASGRASAAATTASLGVLASPTL